MRRKLNFLLLYWWWDHFSGTGGYGFKTKIFVKFLREAAKKSYFLNGRAIKRGEG